MKKKKKNWKNKHLSLHEKWKSQVIRSKCLPQNGKKGRDLRVICKLYEN